MKCMPMPSFVLFTHAGTACAAVMSFQLVALQIAPTQGPLSAVVVEPSGLEKPDRSGSVAPASPPIVASGELPSESPGPASGDPELAPLELVALPLGGRGACRAPHEKTDT